MCAQLLETWWCLPTIFASSLEKQMFLLTKHIKYTRNFDMELKILKRNECNIYVYGQISEKFVYKLK